MRQIHKGHYYFWTIVLGKTQCGKTSAAYRGFVLLRKFLNTTGVPNLAHPTENKPVQHQDEQTPQVTALFPVLRSDGCSKLCVGTASPPLRAAHYVSETP